MGFFDSLADGEARTIKKALKELDGADRHLQSQEAERARGNIDRARGQLEGLELKTCSHPDDYRTAVSRLSKAYLSIGLPVPAKEVLERLSRSLPDDMKSVMLQVELHQGQGRPEEALKVLDDLVARRPKDKKAHIARAELLDSHNRPDDAFQALLKALEADPLDEDTYDLIMERVEDKPLWKGRKASALIHKNKPESALVEVELALADSPGSTTLMMIKVEALEKLGKQDEADDLLEEVLATGPPEPGGQPEDGPQG